VKVSEGEARTFLVAHSFTCVLSATVFEFIFISCTGEAPLGQIFFAGHSGLAGLSPLDLRELSKEEIPKVVSIFARGTKDQQKTIFLAPSATVKDSL
jgi:hypothetical protein